MGELTDERIAPCPKCGSTDTKVWEYKDPSHAFVECHGCSQQGPDGDTAADAKKQWNRWAEHGKLTAELVRLRGENERLRTAIGEIGERENYHYVFDVDGNPMPVFDGNIDNPPWAIAERALRGKE
jgi:hypothetical protein